jgi:hypothetical protein
MALKKMSAARIGILLSVAVVDAVNSQCTRAMQYRSDGQVSGPDQELAPV